MAKKPTSRDADARRTGKPRKLTFVVPADLAHRFSIHAEMLDLDKTGYFCELIRTNCRRFSVHDRGPGPSEPAEAGRIEGGD